MSCPRWFVDAEWTWSSAKLTQIRRWGLRSGGCGEMHGTCNPKVLCTLIMKLHIYCELSRGSPEIDASLHWPPVRCNSTGTRSRKCAPVLQIERIVEGLKIPEVVEGTGQKLCFRIELISWRQRWTACCLNGMLARQRCQHSDEGY
jgi:hypothetical protein